MSNTKKQGIAFATTVLLGIVLTLFLLQGKEFVLQIPEDELQAKMDESLPLTKTYLFIVDVTLSNPRVDLTEGSDRINAGLDVTLNIKFEGQDQELGGAVDISGGVRYEPTTGEFFVIETVVENLAIEGLPEEFTNQANAAVGSVLQAYYESYPIYTLRRTDVKKAAARLLLKSIVVENEEFVVTLEL
jgi:hypothetical protein